MGTFAEQLEAFAAKAKERADAIVGDVVMQVTQSLIFRSPVGDATYWLHPAPKGYVGGAFRGSWQLGVEVRPAGNPGRIDPGGGETVNAALSALPEHPAGHLYYITNNQPYGQRIEEGWSRQAPQGLVQLTAIEWPEMVKRAAAAYQ